jgi:hypothetical protein
MATGVTSGVGDEVARATDVEARAAGVGWGVDVGDGKGVDRVAGSDAPASTGRVDGVAPARRARSTRSVTGGGVEAGVRGASPAVVATVVQPTTTPSATGSRM